MAVAGTTTNARTWLVAAAAVLAVALPAAAEAPPRNAAPRHFADVTGDLPNEAITAVGVDPADDQILYAGTDGFLFKSDDGGESWRPILSFPRGTNDEAASNDERRDVSGGLSVGEDPADDLSTSSREPLLIEDDQETVDGEPSFSADIAGGTDEDMPAGSNDIPDITDLARAGPGVRAIAFVPGSPGVFYVATPRGLYRTTTSGGSFTRLDLEFKVHDDVRDVAVDPTRPSRLYLATRGGLVVTRDGGQTFASDRGRAGTTPATSIAATMTPDGLLVLVGTEAGLFRSTDGGQTFLEVLLRSLPPFSPIAAVAISAATGNFYAGTPEGLFVGERKAALLERYGGVPRGLLQALSPDPHRARGVVGGSGNVFFSSDAGITLDEAEQTPSNLVYGFARGSKVDDLLVATDRGLFRSVPGTGVTVSANALKKLREMWSKEPSIEAVAHDALAWSHLEPDAVTSMRGRASIGKWLPQMSARYQVTAGQTQEESFVLRLPDELPPGVDPDNDTTDVFGNVGAFVLQPSLGLQQVFWVQLMWDLDRVILNDDEIAAARQGPQWWAAERGVLDAVRTAWGARRRLMTEIAMGEALRGRNAAVDEARRQLRVDELTALLDAATGGAFTASMDAASSKRSLDALDVEERR